MALFYAVEPPKTFTLENGPDTIVVEFPDGENVEVTNPKAIKYLRLNPRFREVVP